MPCSILHHDEQLLTVLIDVPTSITEAQGFDDGSLLYSCHARTEPYRSCEPKTEEARRKVTTFKPDEILHSAISELCQAALEFFKDARDPDQPFCLPRQVAVESSSGKLKRKADELESSEERQDDAEQACQVGSFSSLPALFEGSIDGSINPDITLKDQDQSQDEESAPFDGTYFNETDNAVDIHLCIPLALGTLLYRVPARSYCFLGKTENTTIFRSAAKEYSADSDVGIGRFHFIVMDPPWPNFSAKRKNDYQRAQNEPEITEALLGLDLDLSILPGGFIAVWITNAPAVREIVLAELFPSWGVELIEEWVYLKVTSNGDPVTPIDGLWRKPYEILLVGRAPVNRYAPAQHEHNGEVKRRVIAAVPDLHSRKPCVKALVERVLLPDVAANYRALEVYARNLTQGWMSWGDEALKYNEVCHWAEPHG